MPVISRRFGPSFGRRHKIVVVGIVVVVGVVRNRSLGSADVAAVASVVVVGFKFVVVVVVVVAVVVVGRAAA